MTYRETSPRYHVAHEYRTWRSRWTSKYGPIFAGSSTMRLGEELHGTYQHREGPMLWCFKLVDIYVWLIHNTWYKFGGQKTRAVGYFTPKTVIFRNPQPNTTQARNLKKLQEQWEQPFLPIVKISNLWSFAQWCGKIGKWLRTLYEGAIQKIRDNHLCNRLSLVSQFHKPST